MATKVILEFDGRNTAARSIINMLKTVGLFKVDEQQAMNGIEKSLNDIKEGRVYKAKNAKDLMSKI
ncbi:MAG: hypothetical protein Q8S54_12745 [Bacteroidota bacterium]|nr:hypothetical protein [Odoribacter sp.]MDP3644046.1 hypothetical protein [Bacteroidota bacterium]